MNFCVIFACATLDQFVLLGAVVVVMRSRLADVVGIVDPNDGSDSRIRYGNLVVVVVVGNLIKIVDF